MTKSLISALAIVGLIACNKEAKTDASGKKTENSGSKSGENTAENTANPNGEIAAIAPENLAFVEKDGVFTQALKLEVGKTYPFTTKSKIDKSGTGPDGKPMSGSENGLDQMNFTVDSYKDGLYQISLVMTAKNNTSSAMGKTVSVDSNKPEPADQGLKATWRVNKSMMGQVLKLTLSDKAEVKSVKGFEPLYQNIEKSLGSLSKDKKELQMAMQGIKAGFNEQMIVAQMKKSLSMIPAKGVKVGETWTESVNLSPDGKIKNTTTYKFLGLKNNAYEVEITGGLPMKTEKQSPQKDVTVSMSLEVKQKGLVKFDARTGWPTQSSLEVSNSQSQTVSQGPNTQSMSMKTITTTQIN